MAYTADKTVAGLEAKATPIDADVIVTGDSADSDRAKKTTFAQLETWIEANVSHDDLVGFVSNEHIDWTSTTSNLSTSGTAATGNLTVTGTIAVTSTVDGRDIATDGSKLDAVEAGADVTDEANVTAALPVVDETVLVYKTGDATAGVAIDGTAITTGTTRTITMPDANVDLTNTPSSAEKTVLGNTSGTNTGDEVAADLTTAGVVELATIAETNTGTDATRAVTPDGLDGWTGSAQVTTVGTLASGDADAIVSAASTTTAGKIEVATSAETNTGTDAARAVSPDGLAGSNFGIRYVSILCFDYGTDTATGDGKGYFHIPAGLDSMNLVSVHAEVFTAGTTGTTDVQIHNVDNALDMLSTKLTIDSAETGSDTAATAAVINTSNDHVNTNDVIRIDVDAVSTTAAKGLLVTMGFQLA